MGRAEQMANLVLFTPLSVEQLKVWGCFSPALPPEYRLQTRQEVKYLRGKRGLEQLFQHAAPASAGA